jgi:uncharacterized protein (TIGR00297 family)
MLFYPFSVFLLVLLFWRFGGAPHVAAAAWSLMALGDGLSTLLGRSLGRHSLPWNSQKTYLGFFSFLLAGTFGVAFLLWFVSPRTGVAMSWSLAYTIAVIAALVAGFVETFPWRINDNLSVPLIGGAVIYLLGSVKASLLAEVFAEPWKLTAFALLAGAVVAAAYYKRFIGLPRVIAGWIIGLLMLLFAGLPGFVVLVLFFLAQDLVCRYRVSQQNLEGPVGRKSEMYLVYNAVSTVGVAIFLAFWARATPYEVFFHVAMVAALATAFADAMAAELGQLYGGSPYLLPSFRQVAAGTPGAVSLTGTAFGIIAALALGVVAFAFGLLDSAIFIGVVTVSAFVGIMSESSFGPPLIRQGFSPHTLNFLCTLAGALVAMVLYWLL